MAAPSTVNGGVPNGNSASSDHSRKPSVTINAPTGYTPNGAPISAGSRAQISFGQFPSDGNGGSVNNSAPPVNTLSASQHNPRITTPAKSPSPIPQPPASGGRPPSGFQPQNGPPHFGAIGNPENGVGPLGVPQGPGMPGQPIHLRRQSSQQSDISNPPYTPGGGPNRQYMSNQSRQRSFNAGGYSQQFSSSPGPSYRPMPGPQQQRQGYPPQFPGQHNMPHMQQSPGPQRSPSHGSFGQGSHPGTPQMYHQQMHGQYSQQQQQPPYQAFNQHPGQGSETFGMQPGYQQQYAYYQQQGYQMPPQYLNQQGPPSSPSPFRQAPPSARQQYQQQQFNNQPAHQMSRTPSHASTAERPGSSVGGPAQPPPSQTPSSNIRSHTPNQQSKSEFTIPKKRTGGVVIKDGSGNVITFPKKESSAANAGVKSPPLAPTPVAPVSAAATPSPATTPAPGHTRADSKTGKTAEEIKAQFLASVKSSQSTGDKIEEEAATTTPLPAQEEAKLPATGSADAEAKAAEEKVKSDDKPAKEKAQADEKAAKEKVEAEAKAADVKHEREATEAALEKEQAEARVAAEREEKAKADAATAKLEQEQAADAAKKADQAKAEETKAGEATAPADSKPAGAADQTLSDEDAEIERQIAEMEAADKAEAEREAAYAEKKKKAAEEQAARDKAAATDPDGELKRQEREAEELELRRERERAGNEQKDEGEDGADDKEESEMSFDSLKKPTLGPGADSDAVSGTATPASEDTTQPASKAQAVSKTKPSPLKLDVNKAVEPPQQTPGMKSLVSARKLKIQSEDIKYPEGIQSPNPALNKSGKAKGMVYEPAFLMQFADVFKEKPSMDWEQKLKETIGDTSEPQSARSARTPMTGKTPSNRGPPPPTFQQMGSFGAGPSGRTLPAGTTSADRFAISSGAGPGRTMTNPMASVGGPGRGAFPMGQMMPPSRGPSMGNMSNPSRASNSNRGPSKRGGQNRAEEAKINKAMPLTASGEVKALELSKTGWKPTSIGQPAAASQPDLSGHMAPDMVQRKVKAALNKMTPERFDKISDQILVIVAQSKDETDGRTLRQVIALTFEKACDEAHWAEMYAKFCLKMLETMSPDIKDESILGKDGAPVSGGGLFRKYLLNRCQEDFETGWEAKLPEKPEGETEEAAMLSDEYYVAAAAKRKGLGLLQFIGELFKLRMLSIKIMHQCFMRLLDFEGMPDESTIESLTRLMKTVGATLDAADAASAMNLYFQRIEDVLKKEGLPSRMHFMLLDIVDLRKKGWATKDNLKGPTTIQQIREQAAAQQAADAARQAASRQQGRMPSGRGPNNQYGNQMQPPMDYRSSTVSNNELRQLSNRRQASQQASSTRPLGPTSMFSQRSASGRTVGPGGALGRNASGAATMANAEKKKDDSPAPAAANAFAALATMDGETEAPATATPASTEDAKPNGS